MTLFSIERLIGEAWTQALARAGHPGTLACDVGPGATYVRGERDKLAQAVLRLLEDLLGRQDAGVDLAVSCRAEEDYAWVIIDGVKGARPPHGLASMRRLLLKCGGDLAPDEDREGRLAFWLPFLAWSLRAETARP